MVERMAQMTEVARSFEALQRGISVLMNDIDGRAITELRAPLGRREQGPIMIRALYTAASGMNAQQTNIDNTAHNLANVNTVGFKKARVEFEDLVYQHDASCPARRTRRRPKRRSASKWASAPRAVATARDFSTGNLRTTSGPLDLAIEGAGFFQVTLPDGRTAYTRAGAFHLNAEGPAW